MLKSRPGKSGKYALVLESPGKLDFLRTVNQFLFIFFAHIFNFFWATNECVKYCKTVPVVNPLT